MAKKTEIETIMKRRKRSIMFYTLTTLLDNCGSRLEFHTGKFKDAFNNEDQTVMLHRNDGREMLAYDADPDDLEETINGWRAEHPAEFDHIILGK